MPTYRNTGSSPTLAINVADSLWVSFPAGVDVAVEHVVSHADLTLISSEPYYNPVLGNDAVVFAAAGSETVSVVAGTRHIAIWQVSGCNITVYLQAQANTPALATLRPGDSLSIPCNEQFSSVVLVSDGAGSCSVVQGKADIELEG